MNYYILYLSSILSFLCYQCKNVPDKISASKSRITTIIFKNFNFDTIAKEGVRSINKLEFRYLDSNYIVHSIVPSEYDSIIYIPSTEFKTSDSDFELSIVYLKPPASYLSIPKGCILDIINTRNGIIYKIKNDFISLKNEEEYNISLNSINNYNSSYIQEYVYNKFINSNKNINKNNIGDFSKLVLLETNKNIDIERHLLDSFITHRLISSKFYNDKLNQLNNQLNEANLSNSMHNRRMQDSLLKALLASGYPRDFQMAYQILGTRSIKRNSNGKSSGSIGPDYINIYDSINSLHIKNETKRFLYNTNLDRYLSADNISIFSKELANNIIKYLEYSKDSIILNKTLSVHNLDLTNRSLSGNTIVSDYYDITKTLDSILNSHKNCIFYIDFWSSGCAPCRKAMPASKVIRDYFRKDSIVFIYLSIWDRKHLWKKAATVEGIHDYEFNYFIVDSKNNKLLHDLKIDYIPRYVVMNSKGEMINSNAPGPNHPDIKSVLKNYILKYTNL